MSLTSWANPPTEANVCIPQDQMLLNKQYVTVEKKNKNYQNTITLS